MKKFTLIEMLVVIMIISILASMLLPSLRRAISTGRMVQCTNNMKQIYVSAIAYSDDFDYRMPLGYSKVNGSHGRWYAFLFEHNGETSYYRCPDVDEAENPNLRINFHNNGQSGVLGKVNYTTICESLVGYQKAQSREDLANGDYVRTIRLSGVRRPGSWLYTTCFTDVDRICIPAHTTSSHRDVTEAQIAFPNSFPRHENTMPLVYVDGHAGSKEVTDDAFHSDTSELLWRK